MPEARRAPRNVLVIMTDQHRADLMTCAGRDLVPTPSIDRMAARGVRFERAYCPYPVCVASRMAMMTGLYAHTTGAIDNRDRLDWRHRTLPGHFAAQGYLTGLIGKMHFNDAHNHGFEYYLTLNDWLMYLGPKVQLFANEIANHPLGAQFFDTVNDDGAGLPDVSDLWSRPGPWVGNVARYDYHDMTSKIAVEDQLDSFIARETVKFLQRYRSQPFLLVTSFMKPHSPFWAPPEWSRRYPVEAMELPTPGDASQYPRHIRRRIEQRQATDPLNVRAHRAGYLANLAFVDTRVGQVLDALEDLGLADDTLVVYTSDHGEMDGDLGLTQKFCLYEPAVRVPLIFSHPRSLPAGRVSSALVEQIGLYPTLAELTGLPAPEPAPRAAGLATPAALDGHSFADLIRDPAAAGPAEAFSEFGQRARHCQYMLRDRRYKYILTQDEFEELYDHEADPGERRNLALDPAHRGRRDEMRARLLARYDPESNPFRPRQ